MKKISQTYLFCLDEHRTFYDEIKKRFSDETKYKVFPSSTVADFLKIFNEEKEHRFCKIAVLTIYDGKDQDSKVDDLTRDLKKIDPAAGLVIVFPAEKTEEIKKRVKFNIDAYIPKNDNSILRLHNAVKKLISEHNLRIYRRRWNISLYVLLAFLILSGMFLLIAYFRMPVYF